ncbi:MAG: hypothetical protein QM683_03515, partial [Lacrimispora sp.]
MEECERLVAQGGFFHAIDPTGKTQREALEADRDQFYKDFISLTYDYSAKETTAAPGYSLHGSHPDDIPMEWRTVTSSEYKDYEAYGIDHTGGRSGAGMDIESGSLGTDVAGKTLNPEALEKVLFVSHSSSGKFARFDTPEKGALSYDGQSITEQETEEDPTEETETNESTEIKAETEEETQPEAIEETKKEEETESTEESTTGTEQESTVESTEESISGVEQESTKESTEESMAEEPEAVEETTASQTETIEETQPDTIEEIEATASEAAPDKEISAQPPRKQTATASEAEKVNGGIIFTGFLKKVVSDLRSIAGRAVFLFRSDDEDSGSGGSLSSLQESTETSRLDPLDSSIKDWTFIAYDHRTEGEIHFNKKDMDLKAGEKDGYSAYGDSQGDGTLEGAVYGLFAATDIPHPDGHSGVLFQKDNLVSVATTD